MATGKITKRTVDALEPGAGDIFLWDEELRGFGLKLTHAGRRSYVYQYRLGGRGTKTKRWTIGTHGSPWTPATARAEAERLALLVGQGIDPVDAEKVRQREAQTLGFEAYLETFTEGYLKVEWGPSWPQAKRQIEMHALPHLKTIALPALTKTDINTVFDKLQARPALARNVWAVLSKMLSWAARRGDLTANPMATMDPPTGAKARKRVLSPLELTALWHASAKLNDPFGPFVRLLLITLQRRAEVAGLAWKELSHNEKLWRLPGERTKNGLDHLVPLSTLAIAELDARGWKHRGFVFSTTGKTAISGFSRMKTQLDRHMAAELQRLVNERCDLAGDDRYEVKLEPWRLHDLRRTGTTRMQGLKVGIEITERVINHHQGGTTSGIKGIYNLWEYRDEKAEALEAWSDWLSQLVNDAKPASNVVQLAEARA